jgi:hypothetical protein
MAREGIKNQGVSDIYEDKSYEQVYKNFIMKLSKVLDLKLATKAQDPNNT